MDSLKDLILQEIRNGNDYLDHIASKLQKPVDEVETALKMMEKMGLISIASTDILGHYYDISIL